MLAAREIGLQLSGVRGPSHGEGQSCHNGNVAPSPVSRCQAGRRRGPPSSRIANAAALLAEGRNRALPRAPCRGLAMLLARPVPSGAVAASA